MPPARLPPAPPLERLATLAQELGNPGAAALWVAVKRRKLNVTKKQVDAFVASRSEKQVLGAPQRAAGKTVSEDNNRWMMDLIDVSKIDYSGCKFILFCISVFDRVMYARDLKSKEGPVVAAALKDILEEAPERPQVISSDNGSEFTQGGVVNLLQGLGIVQKFKNVNDLNALGLADRNIGLLKRKLKELHDSNNRTWANNLPAAVKALNATPKPGVLHGAAPQDVMVEPEVMFMLMQDQARNIAHNMRLTERRKGALERAGGTFRAPVKLEKFKKRNFQATYGDPQTAAGVSMGTVQTAGGGEFPLKQIKVVPVGARRVAAKAAPKRLGR